MCPWDCEAAAMRTNALLLLVLATAVWPVVVVATASYAASRNPMFWYRTIMLVATVLYLVVVRLIIVWERKSRIRRVPAHPW